jgi:hypothetical protein
LSDKLIGASCVREFKLGEATSLGSHESESGERIGRLPALDAVCNLRSFVVVAGAVG